MVRSNSIAADDSKARADSICTMTMEERAILAWERIADELTLLNQSFEHFLDRDGAVPPARPAGAPTTQGMESSDIGTAPASTQHSAADRESQHPSVEIFSVAGHNYPNLQHGFEQSGRSPDVATDGRGDA